VKQLFRSLGGTLWGSFDIEFKEDRISLVIPAKGVKVGKRVLTPERSPIEVRHYFNTGLIVSTCNFPVDC